MRQLAKSRNSVTPLVLAMDCAVAKDTFKLERFKKFCKI